MLRGPEAETVVMFCDHDDVLGAGGFDGAHPLFGIELSWVENAGIGGAVAPFAIHESVGAKVDDHAEFEILPGDLLRRGF